MEALSFPKVPKHISTFPHFSGMQAAADMCQNASPENQNRIIFLTDMLVSSDEEKVLYDNTLNYVLQKIYFTYIGKKKYKNIYIFLGVGIDFNSDLVSKLTKLRNTNYMSVKSSKDFKRKMDEDFDYLVTPIVYDVDVSFDTKAWKVERVFGSPGFEYPAEGKLAHMVKKNNNFFLIFLGFCVSYS